jgi:carboxyl-terminal processing protease
MKRFAPLAVIALTVLVGVRTTSAQSGSTPSSATPAPAPLTLTKEIKEMLVENINSRVTRLAFVPGKDFSKFPDLLAKYQPRIDAAKSSAEFASAVNSALNEFGVSHMSVITPEAANARSTGGMVGVGIQLELVEQGIRVLSVFKGSPAEKAGLKAGDILTLVNGAKPVARDALSGQPGSVFEVRVLSADGKTRETKITRAFFSTREPESVTWKGETAVLRIPTFDGLPPRPGQNPTGYSAENVSKLMAEIAPKAKSLVIDLRNNPGGVVINMQAFAGYFIPGDKPMGTFVTKQSSARFVAETKKPADDLLAFSEWSKEKVRAFPQSTRYTGPIAVLISGGTGSAAEMVSAALRDTVGARIFGQKSVGMVLASVVTPLDSMTLPREQRTGFQMIVPLQDYITIKGLRIEGNGVEPDVAVAPNPTPDNDLALSEALTWLKSR